MIEIETEQNKYIDFIKNRKAVLFIGAGLSSIAGCLNWNELCEQLNEELLPESRIPLDSGTNIEIITYCHAKLSQDNLKSKKEENIFRNAITPTADLLLYKYIPLIKKIKQINPFPPIITTNVDPCLENTKEVNHIPVYASPEEFKLDKLQQGGIFHIHGYIEKKPEQVWTIFDYDQRSSNTTYKKFLLDVFKNYSVLFLGYSLSDSYIKDQLAFAKRCNTSPHHFALFSSDTKVDEQLFMELYNIKIIRYGTVTEFVEAIGTWIDKYFSPISKIGKERDNSKAQ